MPLDLVVCLLGFVYLLLLGSLVAENLALDFLFCSGTVIGFYKSCFVSKDLLLQWKKLDIQLIKFTGQNYNSWAYQLNFTLKVKNYGVIFLGPR